jgi:type II secretory pathway component GspD/PulD (secretin)
MKKPRYKKIFFFLLIVALLGARACSQTEETNLVQSLVQSSNQDVGRENPFAVIPRVKKVVSQQTIQDPRLTEELPELSVELVTLKFLDAKSTGTAFESMCSRFGKIAILEKVNSLVIFDTKERLAQISTEIKKMDKPVQGLLVYAVALQHLDVKSAKAGLEKVVSPNGNISIVEKSNTLIICDTQEKVQAILAEISKIDKPVSGLLVETVTLKFLDAKSAQAVIIKMLSEYGSISVVERTNSLIICDNRVNLDMILAEIEKIDKPTSGLFIETVTLKFLEAKNLKPVLDKMASQYGSISTNDKTNSLIICDTKENLIKILGEVRKADKTPQQILIEVAILDVQLKDDTEIGINWDLLSDKRYNTIYRQNFTTSRLKSTIESEDTLGDATAFNTTGAGPAGEFSVIIGSVRNIIHMIQEKRDAQIIASPRAMVVSGQSANIKAVEEIPYKEESQTSGGGSLTSTQFKNVGVNLQVTATITDDNDIFLTVDTEQNVKTGESSNNVPVVDTRRANTSLLLRDGQIVVIGGLRRREKTKETNQVPIIGDLPIIGLLFKNTTTVINNSELIVLLSPHIYKGEAVPQEAMAKYNEIKNRAMLKMPDNH